MPISILATIVDGLAVGRKLLGRILQHLFLIRVPLICTLALLAFWRLGRPGEDGGLPTIANMMATDNRWSLGIAAFTALLAAAVIGGAALLAWRLAPDRFGVERIPVPRWLRGASAWLLIPFLLLAAPVLWRLYAQARFPRGRVLAILIGIALAVLALCAIEWLRRKLARIPKDRRLTWLLRKLGPGYWDLDGDRVWPGHGLAAATTAILAVLYVAGYFLLNPARTAGGIVPTIALVLLLITLLCSALSGLAFFLDRFRVPLLLAVVAYAMIASSLFPRDHVFTLRTADEAAPSIAEAARARAANQRAYRDRDRPLVIAVGASGGGIQAAAWTARVLTGLQEKLGADFTRAIYLISSTSGGSVGAFYFVEGIDDDLGAPEASMLDPIRRAAAASSLRETAWGLVFPDFLRAFLPVIDSTYDRAWATERAWLRTLACMKAGIEDEPCSLPLPAPEQIARLSDWRDRARRGKIPAVLFNATFVESGQQVALSNLDLAEMIDQVGRPFDAERWSYGPFDPALERHYPQLPIFDVDAVTAARLSATFPFVTPVARADSDDFEVPPWHLTDGGFFDNHGTVLAVQWLPRVLAALATEGTEADVLYIQINGFPRGGLPEPREHQGWVSATRAPIDAILAVRNSTQLARNDVELALLRQLFGARLEAISFRPPYHEDRSAPPVSWELSPDDIEQLDRDWEHKSNQERVAWLKETYFQPSSEPNPEPPVE